MEEKRDQEELKHVCKLCNKRYPSGKSLGGHMRSHVIANSYKVKPKVVIHGGRMEEEGSYGYGLREHPKKTWRVSDAKLNSNQQRVCKRCGKAFQSLKALCGHMSCHSDKERNLRRFSAYDDEEDEENDDDYDAESEDDDEEEDEEEKGVVTMESNSDNVESEVEHEQEEVAICLMMLSRDLGQKFGGNFTTDSSDNNSVIMDDEKKGGFGLKMKEVEGRKEVKCGEMDSSDSGYFENGAKELESEDSVDGYARKFGLKRPGFEYESGSVESRELGHFRGGIRVSSGFEGNEKLKRARKEVESSSQVQGKYECSICQRGFKTHQALGGHIITHRRVVNGGSKSVSTDGKDGGFGSKKGKGGHKCPFCPKVFRSGQALGGHKRSHLIGCSLEEKANLMQSVERNSSRNHDHDHDHRPLLDLNLPAPSEEEGSGHPQLRTVVGRMS